jgi:leucyl/phenylalanyl-tRNA--protein transferase
MPVFLLSDEVIFPPPYLARSDGLLAIGGDLTPERLLTAYRMGIFPWYSENEPKLWWSPDPRLVLYPFELTVSRSLEKTIRKNLFTITLDSALEQVIRECARVRLENCEMTWLVEEMIDAYIRLHRQGYAHSVEAWHEGELAGGLYGVSLGRSFFGESMFTRTSNASKVAFVHLVRYLESLGYDMIDCQVRTDHLLRFGAREIPRIFFLEQLEESLKHPTRKGHWRFSSEISG